MCKQHRGCWLDVCKHWQTNQSQRSMSEFFSAKISQNEHVINCEI